MGVYILKIPGVAGDKTATSKAVILYKCPSCLRDYDILGGRYIKVPCGDMEEDIKVCLECSLYEDEARAKVLIAMERYGVKIGEDLDEESDGEDGWRGRMT